MGEREIDGKFGRGNTAAKGHIGAGGRSARPRDEQYLAILLKTCTPEDWQKIVVSAITHAKAGDSRARDWLSGYILGKPVERHELSGPDSGPIEVGHSANAEAVAEALRILGAADGSPGSGA